MSCRSLLTTLAGWLLLVSAAQAESARTWGYVAWWMQDAWTQVPLEKFERLVFIELKVGADGRIADLHGWPTQWQALADAAQAQQVPLELSFGLVAPEQFNALFSSSRASRRLRNQLIALARDTRVAGIHVDVEVYKQAHATEAAIAGFRQFVRDLAKKLQRRQGDGLSVFLPMGGEMALYDAATLASAHTVVAQGYDAHWEGSSRAGPVAPLDGPEAVTWVKALAITDRLRVPRSKLRMSFPLYGYEWPVQGESPRAQAKARGRAVTFEPAWIAGHLVTPSNVRERVLTNGAYYDPISGSGRYVAQDADGQHWEGWFEDWWSLTRKRQWLRQENIGGVALFALGYDAGRLLELALLPLVEPATSPVKTTDGDSGEQVAPVEH